MPAESIWCDATKFCMCISFGATLMLLVMTVPGMLRQYLLPSSLTPNTMLHHLLFFVCLIPLDINGYLNRPSLSVAFGPKKFRIRRVFVAEQNALSPPTSRPLAGHCHGAGLSSSSGRCRACQVGARGEVCCGAALHGGKCREVSTSKAFIFYLMTMESRCEEFEGELASIREDVIDSLEDGWVVKSVGYYAFS